MTLEGEYLFVITVAGASNEKLLSKDTSKNTRRSRSSVSIAMRYLGIITPEMRTQTLFTSQIGSGVMFVRGAFQDKVG